jgi:hypothetical protein
MKRRRRYSDDERAGALAALDANRGNVAHTARQLGVPRETLQSWARGRVHPGVVKMCQQKKKALADAIEDLARRLLDFVPAKIEGASLLDVMIAAGIAVDKMLALRQADAGRAQPREQNAGQADAGPAPLPDRTPNPAPTSRRVSLADVG